MNASVGPLIMAVLQYINSAACFALLIGCATLAYRMGRPQRVSRLLVLWSISAMLGVQAATPWVPELLPPVAWSGCVMHTLLACSCWIFWRAEIWVLMQVKFGIPIDHRKHPRRRRSDFEVAITQPSQLEDL